MDDLERLLARFLPEGLGQNGVNWQQRKSAQTRISILEAAIDCLARHGYARTTTQLIAETANISRGAMLHHYATKSDLIEAIVAFSFYKRLQMLAEGVGSITEQQRVAEYMGLEVLWASMLTPEYKAYLELSIAARTDAELREIFIPQARRFNEAWRDHGRTIFPEWASDPDRLERANDVVEAVTEGLVMHMDTWDSPDRIARMRDLLRQMVGMIHAETLAI